MSKPVSRGEVTAQYADGTHTPSVSDLAAEYNRIGRGTSTDHDDALRERYDDKVLEEISNTVDQLTGGGLSTREAQSVALVTNGFTRAGAAELLDVSTGAIDQYVKRAKEKWQEAIQLVQTAEEIGFQQHSEL